MEIAIILCFIALAIITVTLCVVGIITMSDAVLYAFIGCSVLLALSYIAINVLALVWSM